MIPEWKLCGKGPGVARVLGRSWWPLLDLEYKALWGSFLLSGRRGAVSPEGWVLVNNPQCFSLSLGLACVLPFQRITKSYFHVTVSKTYVVNFKNSVTTGTSIALLFLLFIRGPCMSFVSLF